MVDMFNKMSSLRVMWIFRCEGCCISDFSLKINKIRKKELNSTDPLLSAGEAYADTLLKKDMF